MDKKRTAASGNSSSKHTVNQPAVTEKDAIEHRRSNISMDQNVLLVSHRTVTYRAIWQSSTAASIDCLSWSRFVQE
jgi:hypothetical protein